MKILPVILFAAFTITFANSLAQNNTIKTINNGTLKEQYQILLDKSGNYNANGNRYKVIKLITLNNFNANITDSLDIAAKTIVELKNNLAENATALEALKSKLNETSTQLTTLTNEKDSMTFIGALVSKGTYKAIMWSAVFALLFALVFFIYKFRKSNYITTQAKESLATLENEYEQHRRRALEREQKISRELHDERNKNRKKSDG